MDEKVWPRVGCAAWAPHTRFAWIPVVVGAFVDEETVSVALVRNERIFKRETPSRMSERQIPLRWLVPRVIDARGDDKPKEPPHAGKYSSEITAWFTKGQAQLRRRKR